MKKLLTGFVMFSFLLVAANVFAKGPVENKKNVQNTVRNSSFTNIVGNNMGSEVTGWVRYNKANKCLHTTWVISGLEPNTEYQLKLHSKCGDERLLVCDSPNEGDIWECGTWGDESFLVIATVQSDEDGHIGLGVKECRLPLGDYQDMQFIITQNSSPWGSAWTWENTDDSDGDECINDYDSDISTFTIK